MPKPSRCCGQRSAVTTAGTMSVGARAPTTRFPRLCLLFALLSGAASTDYGIPIEIKLWDSGRTPLAHMVDTTNEFGLKVLAEHNFLNDNNIAFSPYGLMGIMVALYEGVDGESSYQIQRGMHLPWNRNVMRIGFRDIHRTLKTYFVPEEGFLAGLALNNENVTFNESYKKVLRFYGFDLDNDQLPTLGSENVTTATNSIETTEQIMTTISTTKEKDQSEKGGPREQTTLNPNAETLNEVDIRGPTTTPMTLASDPNVSNSQSETPSTTTQLTSTNQLLETSTPVPTSTLQVETTTPDAISTIETTESVSSRTSPSETSNVSEVDINTTTVMGSNAAAETTIVEDEISTTSQTTTLNDSETTTSGVETTGTEQSTSENTTPETETTAGANESTIEILERKKKSIVDFIFTNPPYIDDYLVYRSYDVGLDLPIPNFDNKMFLANGLKSVQVTYMHYDTVLEHAYLPHLEAAALRLPLDSERYYLLVVLPSRSGAAELGRLLSRMARESDLSDVYSALRPRRVRAVVPSFTVKGHVTLTTDLQKLGIRDVFEPRQQDFLLMTKLPGVYVRSIEQAVSVAIRKYRPDDQKQNRYASNRQPVTFTATYPFLYFVMDASIHVALMAGKMVDPLNTRIL